MSRKITDIFEELPESEKLYISELCSEFLINPLLSNEIIAGMINENTQLPTVNRKTVVKISDHLGLPKRTPEMVSLSKSEISKMKTSQTAEETLGIYEELILEKFTIDELSKVYKENSIEYISSITGVSAYFVGKILINQGIELKEIVTYKDIIDKYVATGHSIDGIKKTYLNPENSFNDFINHMESVTGYVLPHTTAYRMLKHLNIVKPEELIALAQGRKSRGELLRNLGILKSVGFDSREDLAQYFHENKRLTYARLVKELNKNLDEPFFTHRWLERHMMPYMPADRIVGVSRGELGLREFIKTFYNGEMITGDRQIVRPKELDIVLPEIKLAIEFNGDYWHSDKFMEENHGMTSLDYHLRKQYAARKAGYNLVFVWESDWEKYTDIVEQAVQLFIESGGKIISPILDKLENADNSISETQ